MKRWTILFRVAQSLALAAALGMLLSAAPPPQPPAGKSSPAPKPPAAKATPAPNPLPAKPKPAGPVLTLPAKNPLLDQCLKGPLANVEDIVFTVRTPGKDGHWYANFGYFIHGPDRPLYGERGRLCRLNLRTRKLTLLLDDPQGSVRDPQVHYDARKILFSYRKGGQPYYHLHEINVDGTGLRQLTRDPFDDIEPTYLPGGGIMFASSRCNRWVNCFLTPVAVLYRCDADGRNVRPLSSNNEHENSPWPLPDGRVIYTRWEYIDRNQLVFHHLWAINPDGTNATIYFGNMVPGYVMIDAKPIPKTNKVVAVFCPGHGRIEHAGEIRVIDPSGGPDARPLARRISPEKNVQLRDPYPLSPDLFLVAQAGALLVMNSQGQLEPFYQLPKEEVQAGLLCQEPRPIAPRARERVIPPRVDLAQSTGQVILADVRNGRNMGGVEPGEIKKLLVLESLPMPVHFQGGMRPITAGGSFTLERILGTIPVEPDGSACAEVPALRSLFFVALDKNGLSVKRMQSFFTVQPGETLSCAGCHESRVRAPNPVPETRLQALGRPPSPIEPIPGVPQVIDFPRDIQPILDKHCLQCHDHNDLQGGVDLCGDHGPMFSHSYYSLDSLRQAADGRNLARGNRPPRTIGSSASPLMRKIDGSHYGATLSPHERDLIRLWIETGAAYPGTYAALATGSMAELIFKDVTAFDADLPSVKEAAKVIAQRCAKCHNGPTRLPPAPSNGQGGRFASALLYDLTRPERSLILMAPLARNAGGIGMTRNAIRPPVPNPTPVSYPFAPATPTPSPARPTPKPQTPPKSTNPIKEPIEIFADASDPDYQKILAAIRDCKAVLEQKNKRFDMPGFRPRAEYIREMKHYGILAENLGPNDPVDPYATDKAYWQSLWFKPVGVDGLDREAGSS